MLVCVTRSALDPGSRDHTDTACTHAALFETALRPPTWLSQHPDRILITPQLHIARLVHHAGAYDISVLLLDSRIGDRTGTFGYAYDCNENFFENLQMNSYAREWPRPHFFSNLPCALVQACRWPALQWHRSCLECSRACISLRVLSPKQRSAAEAPN